MLSRSVTLTPRTLVALLLVLGLSAFCCALAMQEMAPPNNPAFAGAAGGMMRSDTPLKISDYRFGFDTLLTGVDRVHVLVANTDPTTSHEAVVYLALGNSNQTATQTGTSARPFRVPAGGHYEETLQLDGVLDFSDLDWIRTVVEEVD